MADLDINIFGSYSHAQLPSVAVADVSQEDLYSAMAAFVAEEEAFVGELQNLLADTPSDIVTESFGTVKGGTFRKQGEVTNLEAREIGDKWTLGYPIDAWGDRVMYTQAYLDDISLAELNQHVLSVALADARGFVTEMNRALLVKDNRTHNDDVWPGRKTGNAIAVRALANADGAAGSVYANFREVPLGTLNHYLISGNATLNAAAFTTARDALRNVGHDSQIVYLCSRATADAAEGLTASGFVPRQDNTVVDPQAKYALVTSPRARGRIAKGEVWEWPHFPDNYIFAFDRTKAKPLHQRFSEKQKYRGLQMALPQESTAGDIQGKPLVNKLWRRLYGFGVRNRVNGVCVQVKASGTYDNPTTLI